MRPVRRGASPRAADFEDYEDAKPDLVSRLGPYCSYCERRIATMLAVEHIQPKGLPAYAALAGRWENLLLACVNCNSTKRDDEVRPADVLLPDRDNTAAAYLYPADGRVEVAPAAAAVEAQARETLRLVGLDKPLSVVLDANGRMVALDRVAQRMEARMIAEEARGDIAGQPESEALRRAVAQIAAASGFFSVWMTVFADDVDMRRRLVAAFPGTGASGCFDDATGALVCPAPNPDGLADGGKV